jgi:protein involved in ribonucleotide reduction
MPKCMEAEEPDKIKWSACEVVGSPVLSLETKETINRPLEVGERLVVQTLFSLVEATVTEVDGDKAGAVSGRLHCFLVYEHEPRACWVCTASGNLDAIAKVQFT